jgi:hypothetical protein
MKIETQRPHEPRRRLTLPAKMGIGLCLLVVLAIFTALYSLFWGLKPLPTPPAIRIAPLSEPPKLTEMASDNGALFYLKAIDLLQPMPRGVENQVDLFLVGDPLTRVDEVEKVVGDHAEALSMIRKGNQSAKCQLPWLDQDWVRHGEKSAVVALQRLAKLMLAHGFLNEQRGNAERAAADYVAVAVFGKNCASGAPQSGSQIGSDIRRMGIYFLRSVVWRAQLSRENLQFIAQELEEIARSLDPFAETVRHELIERKRFCSRTLADKPFHFPYSEDAIHRMLDAAYGEAIEKLEKPTWETAVGDWERKWFIGDKSYAANAFDRMYSRNLFLMTMTSFRQTFDTTLATNVHQDGAMVACALRRYSLERGGLPDSLEKLTPHFLKAVPIDPYDGQPLRFRVRGEQWVLWSIGSDRADNDAESRATDTDPRGDIVVDSSQFGTDFRRDFPKLRGE